MTAPTFLTDLIAARDAAEANRLSPSRYTEFLDLLEQHADALIELAQKGAREGLWTTCQACAGLVGVVKCHACIRGFVKVEP